MRFRTRRWSVLALLFLAAPLCGAAGSAAAAAAKPPRPAAPAPGLAELKNMNYSGFVSDTGPVTLTDGRYAGEPYAPGAAARRTVTFGRDFRLTGDLDGDGQDEAVVVLAENTGGSGTFDYLAVVGRRQGKPVNLATVPLGDRVQVREARIAGRRLVVDVLRAGPGDAMCCPGELATVAWEMKGGKLAPAASGVAPRRLTPAAIADTEWVLHSWGWDEPVPEGIEITFRLAGDRVTGLAACNRYFAAAAARPSPGDLTIGTAGATKMACSEPQMAAESRFLAQLAGVRGYSFLLGELVLGWSRDGQGGAMLFARRAQP
jgi:heat shock protein HslJ